MESYNFLSYDPRKDKPQLQLVTEMLDTRYFMLSNETYLDRKKDAAERIKAGIDFVNSDQECRSMQLLRYFNETGSHACGRCDVCAHHASHELSVKAFDQIRDRVLELLRQGPMPVGRLAEVCQGYDEEEVMDTIRWMIDDGVLEKDDDEMLLVKQKK